MACKIPQTESQNTVHVDGLGSPKIEKGSGWIKRRYERQNKLPLEPAPFSNPLFYDRRSNNRKRRPNSPNSEPGAIYSHAIASEVDQAVAVSKQIVIATDPFTQSSREKSMRTKFYDELQAKMVEKNAADKPAKDHVTPFYAGLNNLMGAFAVDQDMEGVEKPTVGKPLPILLQVAYSFTLARLKSLKISCRDEQPSIMDKTGSLFLLQPRLEAAINRRIAQRLPNSTQPVYIITQRFP